MSVKSDPSWHQQREAEILRHVESLLSDKRFVVDTGDGRRPLTQFKRSVNRSDRSVEIKRRMIELGVADSTLQKQLPVGWTLDVRATTTRWWIFEKTLADVKLIVVSPTDSLIKGEPVTPMTEAELRQVLGRVPPPLGSGTKSRVPQTLLIVSTSGFTNDATKLADRLSERTVILIEPLEGGGWSVHGVPEVKGVLDALDPETEAAKRHRIREAVDSAQRELATSGIAAEKLAAQLVLPLDKVERELKQLAADRPGLAAKRFDGRLVIYRESTPPASGGAMPIVDRIKSLFSGSTSPERKIAFLAEKRTAISQQRDIVSDEVAALEQHEADLREQFQKNTSAIVRRRITQQVVQLRRDIERKQQMLQVLNQQLNVVAAHQHSLELIQQGQSIKLPDGDEMAADAAKAEEVLAELEAEHQLADELSGGVTLSGMSEAEQAVYEELMGETAPAKTGSIEPAKMPPVKSKSPAPAEVDSESTPQQQSSRRAPAEPG